MASVFTNLGLALTERNLQRSPFQPDHRPMDTSQAGVQQFVEDQRRYLRVHAKEGTLAKESWGDSKIAAIPESAASKANEILPASYRAFLLSSPPLQARAPEAIPTESLAITQNASKRSQKPIELPSASELQSKPLPQSTKQSHKNNITQKHVNAKNSEIRVLDEYEARELDASSLWCVVADCNLPPCAQGWKNVVSDVAPNEPS